MGTKSEPISTKLRSDLLKYKRAYDGRIFLSEIKKLPDVEKRF